MRKTVLIAALLCALSLPLAAQEASQVLASDTPTATANGNPFVAPMGWTLSRKGPAVILTAPEGGSHIALVDVAAKDADAAVAAAWAAYDPKAKWPLKLATDRPARDGWEQTRSYASTRPRRTTSAACRRVASRAATRWTVVDLRHGQRRRREAQRAGRS